MQPKGWKGRADVTLTMISKLYGVERDLKDACDGQRFMDPQNEACRFSGSPKAGSTRRTRKSRRKACWAFCGDDGTLPPYRTSAILKIFLKYLKKFS